MTQHCRQTLFSWGLIKGEPGNWRPTMSRNDFRHTDFCLERGFFSFNMIDYLLSLTLSNTLQLLCIVCIACWLMAQTVCREKKAYPHLTLLSHPLFTVESHVHVFSIYFGLRFLNVSASCFPLWNQYARAPHGPLSMHMPAKAGHHCLGKRVFFTLSPWVWLWPIILFLL